MRTLNSFKMSCVSTAVKDMHYLLNFSNVYVLGFYFNGNRPAGTPFHLTRPP